MKKEILIISLVLSALLIMNLVVADKIRGTNYSRCISGCNDVRQADHSACVNNYKTNSNTCKNNFNLCNVNNMGSNKTSRKDYFIAFKECNKNFTSCKKEASTTRNLCYKDAINNSKICKTECNIFKFCPTVYDPICGINNVTYTNECELNKANVKKDCNKECPCKNIGGDTDSHGCYLDAGYTWCDKKQKCIRLWEENCSEEPEKHMCTHLDCTSYNDCNFACPTLYDPVCGWFDNSIICYKYPCAETYSNSCIACADSKVKYWTSGECPNPIIGNK